MDHKKTQVVLKSNDYATWKIQIKMQLNALELFNIVDGNETVPDDESSANYKKFCARRDKALAVIVLSVDPSLLYLLEDPTDPSLVWTKLSSIFQKKSWANKLSLKKRLYKLKLRAGDSLQQHLKTFVETFAELAVVGDAAQDEDKVICLLASLPDDYATLVTALEASESVPTWETITERLLHHESKISRKSNADDENSLLLT